MRAYTQPGLTAWTSSGPRFHFSIVPGRKFSTTTSAVAHSSRARRWQSSVRRLSATERLPRAITDHHSEWPLCLCWPHSRSASPFGGASTLMTSAPKSASSVPTYGPAMSWPNSTTRRPDNGPSGSGVSAVTGAPLPRRERGPTRGDGGVRGRCADLRRAAGDEGREDHRGGGAGGVERRAREDDPPRVAQLLDPGGGPRVRRLEAQAMGALDGGADLAKGARERRQVGVLADPAAGAPPRGGGPPAAPAPGAPPRGGGGRAPGREPQRLPGQVVVHGRGHTIRRPWRG